MELEQLVSGVRYYISQHQFFNSLDAVLSQLLALKDTQAELDKAIASRQAQVTAFDTRLAAMEATEAEKARQLCDSYEAKGQALAKTHAEKEAVSHTQIRVKTEQIANLDSTILEQTRVAEQLALDINQLQADKTVADKAYQDIKQKLIAFKASL
jgi:predicted RNase H-like nuclease (RuvC/YqgF family)